MGKHRVAEVAAAMVEASQACVDIAELQAAASRVIAEATGAEAGYVASGASACLLIGAAACITGLDPGKMARLPDTTGMKSECVMVRSQRNFYDHAIRAAGLKIVEVGLPVRYAGAGVRDASAGDFADAITPRTAGLSSFGAGGSNAHLIIEEHIDARGDRGIEPARALQADAQPVVVLSKLDLVEDPADIARSVASLEEVALGVPVHAASGISSTVSTPSRFKCSMITGSANAATVPRFSGGTCACSMVKPRTGIS